MSTRRVIAVLGRRDQPTDAVEEYCRHLAEALAEHDCQMELRRVPWSEHGWSTSFNALRQQSASWKGVWILLQYTALAWSNRGFPRRFLSAIRVLRRAGARIAVVYHDVEPFAGRRFIDRLRRNEQLRVMRAASSWADRSIFTVPLENVSWLSPANSKAHFIPVGANLPILPSPQDHSDLHSPPTVAVYGITGGIAGDRETGDIVAALRFASARLGSLRLLAFGRHSDSRESSLREGLKDSLVKIQAEGVIEEAALLERFAASDVLLFVRGTISSRRGSAIAGITCGLPLIAFRGQETAAPLTEAGVVLLDELADDRKRQELLGTALVELLTNSAYRTELVDRSNRAQQYHFSWKAIAARYSNILLS